MKYIILSTLCLAACAAPVHQTTSPVQDGNSPTQTTQQVKSRPTGTIVCHTVLGVTVDYRSFTDSNGDSENTAAIGVPDKDAHSIVYHASSAYAGDDYDSDAVAGAVWLGSPLTGPAIDSDALDPSSPKYDADLVSWYPQGQVQGSLYVVGVDPNTLELSVSGDGLPTQGSTTACVRQ